MEKYWQPDQEEQLREIGLYLQQQRQARQLSVDAVSEKTRIRSGLILALELGQVEELPEPIYLKGFIKRYAEFLGLDGNAVAVSVPVPLVKLPSSGDPPIRFHAPSLGQTSGSSAKILIGIGTIALVLGMIFGWQVWSKGQKKAQQEEASIATPAPTVKPEPVIHTLTFQVEATDDTWLEVTVDGKALPGATVTKGYRQTWTAKQKVKLYAARSENIKISLNGKPPQVFGEGEKEASFPVAKPAAKPIAKPNSPKIPKG